ncbi:hypothetical protein, partial [Trinickia diaoshuihuensis]|uniref:hypothetical protein n=1 Tax=Trinickia diaoshuihuensis TaxID=2292265 RepID=UPI0019677303
KTIGRFSRNSPLEIDRRQFVHTPLLTLALCSAAQIFLGAKIRFPSPRRNFLFSWLLTIAWYRICSIEQGAIAVEVLGVAAFLRRARGLRPTPRDESRPSSFDL